MNDSISINEIIRTFLTRYGQLVTDIDIYLHKRELIDIITGCVKEYSFFIPLTKWVNVMATANGVYLGEDVINVRNVKIATGYYDKYGVRLDKRDKWFDKNTKILKVPYDSQVCVELAVQYPIKRTKYTDSSYTVLSGDSVAKFFIDPFTEGSLKITIGEYEWKEADEQECTCGDDCDCKCDVELVSTLEGSEGTYFKSKNLIKLTGLHFEEDQALVLQYNPVFPIINGLTLRDKLFIDLCMARLLIALGNMKSQLIMDGDVVGFANDELTSKGEALLSETLEQLRGSSTTHKVF